MATKTQQRVLMAMYPAHALKNSAYGIAVGNNKVARSTFYGLLNEMLIVATDSTFRTYQLSDKGRAEAEKGFRAAFPAQQEMIVVPYRYCYNSYGLNLNLQVRTANDHLPSLDGYCEGDKLTLAYEGEVATAVSEKGCETLFALFNEPWKRPDEFAGPSMSVGDVVTFFPGTEQEVSFAVDRVGFVRVDISKSKIEDRPARWIRSGHQLDDYRREKAECIGA